MVKRILVALVAVLGLSAMIAPIAVATPTVPLMGYKVDYDVTATINGMQTNSTSMITFTRDNGVSRDWVNVTSTPWSLEIYTRTSPYGIARIDAKATNPNPVYGVIKYHCTISVNGHVVLSRSRIGGVTCAI
jgi:hypothetical protein